MHNCTRYVASDKRFSDKLQLSLLICVLVAPEIWFVPETSRGKGRFWIETNIEFQYWPLEDFEKPRPACWTRPVGALKDTKRWSWAGPGWWRHKISFVQWRIELRADGSPLKRFGSGSRAVQMGGARWRVTSSEAWRLTCFLWSSPDAGSQEPDYLYEHKTHAHPMITRTFLHQNWWSRKLNSVTINWGIVNPWAGLSRGALDDVSKALTMWSPSSSIPRRALDGDSVAICMSQWELLVQKRGV